MKKYIFLIISLLGVGILAQGQSYKVIVNPSNSVSSLSAIEVSNYFLKKTVKWDSGEKVAPVDLSSSSAVRESFSTSVLGKSVSAVKSYWQQYVFAGKGTPPVEKGSDAEVIEFVQKNPGAIGYISSSTNTPGVKVVTVN